MSPDVIAVGVFGIAGVVVERIARSWGRLRFEVSERKLELTGVEDEEGYERPVPLEDADETTEAHGASYVFRIDLFNGKEVPTGLRDVRVELIRDSGRPITSRADDLETGRPHPVQVERSPLTRMVYDKLDVLNIPPRQFKHLELRGGFGGKEVADAIRDRRWRSIDFVAEFPAPPIFGILGSKDYRKTITEPKDWPRR